MAVFHGGIDFYKPSAPSPDPLKYYLYGGQQSSSGGGGNYLSNMMKLDPDKAQEMLPLDLLSYLSKKSDLELQMATLDSKFAAEQKKYGIKNIPEESWTNYMTEKGRLMQEYTFNESRVPIYKKNYKTWESIIGQNNIDPNKFYDDGSGNFVFDFSTGEPISVGDWINSIPNSWSSLDDEGKIKTIGNWTPPKVDILFEGWNNITSSLGKSENITSTEELGVTSPITINGKQYDVVVKDKKTSIYSVDAAGGIKTGIAENVDQLNSAWDIYWKIIQSDPELGRAYNYARNSYVYNSLNNDETFPTLPKDKKEEKIEATYNQFDTDFKTHMLNAKMVSGDKREITTEIFKGGGTDGGGGGEDGDLIGMGNDMNTVLAMYNKSKSIPWIKTDMSGRFNGVDFTSIWENFDSSKYDKATGDEKVLAGADDFFKELSDLTDKYMTKPEMVDKAKINLFGSVEEYDKKLQSLSGDEVAALNSDIRAEMYRMTMNSALGIGLPEDKLTKGMKDGRKIVEEYIKNTYWKDAKDLDENHPWKMDNFFKGTYISGDYPLGYTLMKNTYYRYKKQIEGLINSDGDVPEKVINWEENPFTFYKRSDLKLNIDAGIPVYNVEYFPFLKDFSDVATYDLYMGGETYLPGGQQIELEGKAIIGDFGYVVHGLPSEKERNTYEQYVIMEKARIAQWNKEHPDAKIEYDPKNLPPMDVNPKTVMYVIVPQSQGEELLKDIKFDFQGTTFDLNKSKWRKALGILENEPFVIGKTEKGNAIRNKWKLDEDEDKVKVDVMYIPIISDGSWMHRYTSSLKESGGFGKTIDNLILQARMNQQ